MNKTNSKKNKKSKKKKSFNKNIIIFPIILIVILIIIIIPKKDKEGNIGVDYSNNDLKIEQSFGDTSIEDIITEQKDTDEIKIGINKYLEFLWMVDGAFDTSKNKFEVNGEKINDLSFKCEYRGTNDKCYGVDFEENYNRIFSKQVSINRVYGDGVSLKWYEKVGNDYVFYPPKSCTVKRMNLKQSIILKEKTSKELKFLVYYNETVDSGFFKGNHQYEKEFVLVKEDGSWKVRKAYYHNPCYIEYNVE